jgi:hypothetical protein
MGRARWYVKSGDSERGPYSAHRLKQMAQTGLIEPATLVRKGNRHVSQSSEPSSGWKRAAQVFFLAEVFTCAKAANGLSQGNYAALAEFLPNLDPDEYDEDSLAVFSKIVAAIHGLREAAASGAAKHNRIFSLELNDSDWDDDSVAVLLQIERALEELRAAIEDGVPVPGADYVLEFDESAWHDDVVAFIRQVQSALNGLREDQQLRRLHQSQETLFDMLESPEKPENAVTPPTRLADGGSGKDEGFWTGLVSAARERGESERVIVLARRGVHEHPRSKWLWLALVDELTALDRLDAVEATLNAASRLNPNADWPWRRLAHLHRKRKRPCDEIAVLEKLYALGSATWNDLQQLGIAYYKQHDYTKSLHYLRLSAAATSDATPAFTLATVFSDPEVSRDLDAADAYRRALTLKPDFARARMQFEKTKGRLLPLAAQLSAAAADLLKWDEVMQFYISPFEAFQIDGAAAVEELDVRVIQRGKQRLLQELDLNDGKVKWLDDYSLDRSRALDLDDELFDEDRRRYHWAIFQNKHLLRFLTRGAIDHFLYSEDYFPRGTLELLEREPAFRSFLSGPFSRQYNLVLTRAIKRRLLPALEALFLGRRWVESNDNEACFEGADREISGLVELMRGKAVEWRRRKVSLDEINVFLREHSFVKLFNLLPDHFAPFQKEVVKELRSLAISCFNAHGDSALSKSILSLCNRFKFRSIQLSTRLEGDVKRIEEIIREEEKHSLVAPIRVRQTAEMTRGGIGGIKVGGLNISASEKAAAERAPAEREPNPLASEKSGLLWVVGIVTILIMTAVVFSLGSPTPRSTPASTPTSTPASTPTSTPASGTPSTAARPPAYSALPKRSERGSESTWVYRVPTHMKAELDRESKAIDSEKTIAAVWGAQLERLSRELERDQADLNHTSRYEVNQFNRKVDAYNSLLERVRAQERLVNRMVELYNAKLEQYGR